MANCKTCLHAAVCAKRIATGGHVKECKNFVEKKTGRWLNWKGEPIERGEFRWAWTCSECKHELEFEEAVTADEFASNFCPNCGADMRGGEDA